MGRKRLRVLVTVVATIGAGVAAGGPRLHVDASQTLSVSVSGSNGIGSSVSPGRPCSAGGTGQYHHMRIDAPLAANTFSKQVGTLRGTLDIHTDLPQGTLSSKGPSAFLLGDETHVTMENERGALQIRLVSSGAPGVGICPQPTLSFDGTTVAGSGTWTVAPPSSTQPTGGGSGAYRYATGSGTFTLRAATSPGAINPWSLQLSGSITVAQPTLAVQVVSTNWGDLGVDYAKRIVTVVYTISNTGPGDSFNARLTQASSPTPGVTSLATVPQDLGDLLAGDSVQVSVRYQLGLTQPCSLVILNCAFTTVIGVDFPDALDVDSNQSQTQQVKAPALPPPV